MKPMFALQKDVGGNVLSARDFTSSYQISDWLKGLDIWPGDRIEFQQTCQRSEFDEVPEAPPAFIETTAPAPALAGDDQPF